MVKLRSHLQWVVKNARTHYFVFCFLSHSIDDKQKNVISLPKDGLGYFLIERSSKLLRGFSRLPFVGPARVKDDDLDSNPGWVLWAAERRPLLETSRLERPSPGSPEELGRLLEITALFEMLPFLD